MNILIIGGKHFVGRALVETALAAGHTLTLFNRGQSNSDWFPEVENITGDRNGDLSALQNRHWQAVIDTCGYFPRQVNNLLTAIGTHIDHYTFISSISAYADFSKPGLREGDPVAKIDDPSIEEITGESYGALKALCEQSAETLLPERVLTVRPGLIVGPYDLSDRFTYWPVRVQRGGEILVPDSPDWLTQIIDVRDLAEWTIRLVENKVTGIFNATGPEKPLTIGAVLEASCKISGNRPEFTWVSTKFLLEKGVQPWSELPMWLPGEEDAGGNEIDNRKAVQHGLTFSPIERTIEDTLAWEATRPPDHPWRAGLPADRERQLLEEWRKANLQA